MKRAASSLRLSGLVTALLLGGCGTGPKGLYLHPGQVVDALRNNGVDPSAVVLPYGLTDEMRNWAHEAAPKTLKPLDRLRRLRDRLLSPDAMELQYVWGYTGTAIEVFEQRQANCLAFTNLFVGMAREIGVPVFFMAVDDTETYRKEGDLVVVSDHVAVGYGTQLEREIFDFSETPADDYRLVRRITDLTAIAMYHSNRGAEALQRGRVEESLQWLRVATAIDPELANAWVNLGVSLRRAGAFAEAEHAYKRALEIDPRVYSAYHNLASVLRLQEREQEAQSFETALEKSPSRNPYTYLTLGDISLSNGHPELAERYYRRAINLSGENPEPYAALGQLALANGDLRTARRMLRRAQKIDADDYRTRRLAEMVDGGSTS